MLIRKERFVLFLHQLQSCCSFGEQNLFLQVSMWNNVKQSVIPYLFFTWRKALQTRKLTAISSETHLLLSIFNIKANAKNIFKMYIPRTLCLVSTIYPNTMLIRTLSMDFLWSIPDSRRGKLHVKVTHTVILSLWSFVTAGWPNFHSLPSGVVFWTQQCSKQACFVTING